jgi:integrase/recombinase XerC
MCEAEAIEAFLQRLSSERRLAAHTVSAYRRDLRALLDFCAREGVSAFEQLDAYHVRRFAAAEHRRGLAVAMRPRSQPITQQRCR